MNITGGTTVPFPVLKTYLKNYQGIGYNWKTSTFAITETGPRAQSDPKHVISYNYEQRTGHIKKVASHSYPVGIATDFISNTVYYTDSSEGEVSVISGNNKYSHIIMTSLPECRGLALDPVEGRMFVSGKPGSGGGTSYIISAYMDGSNRQTIVSQNLNFPLSLATDRKEKWLYWTDVTLARIEKCRYDGTSRQTVKSLGSLKPLSLTIDEMYVYFTLNSNGQIHRMLKTGGALQTVSSAVSSNLTHIFDLVAITPALQVDGLNGCSLSNGNCAQLCLPMPSGRHKCACDDKYTLDANGRSCIQSKFEKVLLVTDNARSGIFLVDIETGGYLRMSLFNLHKPTGISWDANYKTFFWASEVYKRIGRSCIYPKSCVDNIAAWSDDSHVLKGVAVDPFNEHIYIADKDKIIRIGYQIDGPITTVIDLGIASARGLALDLPHRWIFWTEAVPTGKIRKAFMDGSNSVTVIDSDIIAPNDVVVDPTLGEIYWCDGGKKTIEVSSTSGQNRRVLHRTTNAPLSLTFDDSHIYFSELGGGSLHRIDRNTGGGLSTMGPSFFNMLYDIIYIDVLAIPPRPPGVTTTTSTTHEDVAETTRVFKNAYIILPAAFTGLLIFIAVTTTVACIVTRRRSSPPITVNGQTATTAVQERPELAIPMDQAPLKTVSGHMTNNAGMNPSNQGSRYEKLVWNRPSNDLQDVVHASTDAHPST